MGETRHVWIRHEYLDGVMGLMVEIPSEYDPEVMVIPAALLDAHALAEKALREAENALEEAARTAPRRKNPKFIPVETDDA